MGDKQVLSVMGGVMTATPGTKTLVEEMALAVCEDGYSICEEPCEGCKVAGRRLARVMLERMRSDIRDLVSAKSAIDEATQQVIVRNALYAFAREHGLLKVRDD